MSSEKLEILKTLNFGKRIAEDEATELSRYFYETHLFRELRDGKIDIVYGQKGAGKSAMYVALKNDTNRLFDSNILLVAAEKPTGTPAFSSIVTDPPNSEREFEAMWKLYFLSLVATKMEEFSLSNTSSKKYIALLNASGLVTTEGPLSKFVRSALDLARRLLKPNEFSTTIELDPTLGLPTGVTGSISLSETSSLEAAKGITSVAEMFRNFNQCLSGKDLKVWLCIDRLDVAFSEDVELETNALRALFRVYRDLEEYESIRLKIFLRSDIWARITKTGFRESSHITKSITIKWNANDLQTLVVRRMAQSHKLLERLGVKQVDVYGDIELQRRVFDSAFPERVYSGKNKAKTWAWILSRTADATDFSAPREILHLLTTARDELIKRLENGFPESSDGYLFDRQSIRDALAEVSKVRIEQTLFQEFPAMKEDILAFRGAKAEQTLASLKDIWKCTDEDAQYKVARLEEIGFLRKISDPSGLRVKIPFIYRSYLDITQGAVGSSDTDADETE